MKIFNPAEEFKKTPTNFQEESEIINISLEDRIVGIVFPSLEKVHEALRSYPVLKFDETIPPSYISKRKKENNKFVESLIGYIDSELSKSNEVRVSIGTLLINPDFDKTQLNIKKIGDNYVLQFPDTDPKNEFLKGFDNLRAIESSNLDLTLSLVDNWWFNIDFQNILNKLPIHSSEIKGIAHSNLPSYPFKKPELLLFDHNNNYFILDINLDVNKFLKPEGSEGKKLNDFYMQSIYDFGTKQDHLRGGSWERKEKGLLLTPEYSFEPVQPILRISVALFDESIDENHPTVAVTQDQIKILHEARDYIANLYNVEK